MDSKTLRMVGSQMSISGRLSEKSNSDSTRKPRIRSAAVTKKQTLLRAKHAVRPKSAEAPGDSWSEASEVCVSERLGTLGYTSSSTELLQTLIDSSDLKTTHQVTFDDEIGNGLRREVAKSYENIRTQDEEFQFATCLASAQSGNECSKMEIYISNSSGLSEEEKTEINESDEPQKHTFFDVAERSLDKDDTIVYYSSKPCDKETDSEEDVIHSSRRETIVNAPVNNELQVTAMYTSNRVDRSEENSKCEKLADEVRLSEREKYDSSISSKFDTVTEENLPQTSKEVSTQGTVAGVSEHSPLDLSKTSKIKERKEDGTVCLSADSTYEEIVQLLKTIDEEEDEDTSFRGKRASAYDFFDGNLVELKNVHSFLEKMEKESDTLIQRATDHKKDSSIACHQETFLSPRVRDLMKKTPVELAHQVHTLNLQIDDQKKGIKLLRETLREEKQKTEELRLSHKEAMEKANAEAEVLVQRHQKFIKQLLNEKKNLNETVTNLVSDLKLKEEKFKKNMKAMEERHQIEVKRAKEAQATADKIKREKWMESKTQKIKEMTVKGLEPELTRMAAIQQEQIQELKALQKVELETVKEKAAEKTSVLLEDLRMDLLRERTTAIARETENLRIRMEKEFQVERDQYENTIKKLREHIKIEEEKLNDQETAFSHRMLKCRREFDDEKERMVRDFNEKSDETRRHHEVELGKLRESLEAEKEIWMINSKKQEEMKLLEREGELREQCKRDRDREIERVIDMVEKEYSRQQSELNEETENKLKKLRLKFESEMKEAEANENFLKEKLSKVKCQLAGKEETIAELNSEIRQLQGDLTFQKKRCKEMTSERSNLTDIIRREFETKLDEMDKGREVLEKEMQALREKHLLDLAKKDELNLKVKNEMQRELTKVYSRIKTASNKKDAVIESLKNENKATLERCQELELLLDRQRRNLLLQ